MTESAQHIALLTSMGWTSTLVPSNAEMEDARLGRGVYAGAAGYPIGGGPLGGMQMTQWCAPDGKLKQRPELTLDLMHEAVNTLTDDQHSLMAFELSVILGLPSRWLKDATSIAKVVDATKEQRREAYLKVKGLWV